MGLTFQGGGVTEHKGVSKYIDLVVNTFENIDLDFPQSVELFRSFAKHTQGTTNFGYAELDTDKRLFHQLSRTGEGAAFYKYLKASAPLITVSAKILGDTKNIKNVLYFKISDFESHPLEMLEKFANAANLKTKKKKTAFLDKLEMLCKIISLRPGLFGVTININTLIEEWIKKKRETIL